MPPPVEPQFRRMILLVESVKEYRVFLETEERAMIDAYCNSIPPHPTKKVKHSTPWKVFLFSLLANGKVVAETILAVHKIFIASQPSSVLAVLRRKSWSVRFSFTQALMLTLCPKPRSVFPEFHFDMCSFFLVANDPLE
ncbi:MFS domain-containing protein [Psidium guajava]|nr:MFS domain-containing protein [Psidium guajava]